MTDRAAIDRLLLRDRWIVGGCVAAIAVLALALALAGVGGDGA